MLVPRPTFSQSAEIVYGATITSGAPGDTVEIFVTLDNFSDNGLPGASFTIWNDPALVTINGFVVGTAPADLGAEFVLTGYEPYLGWASFVMIMDSTSPFEGQLVPPGSGYELAIATYTLDADGPIVVPIELESCSEPGGTTTSCIDGGILICEPSGPGCGEFLRGDANADGVFVALPDALFTLAFQFTQGPAPPCLDAADFDDDGALNGLVDAVAMLAYQFLGGPPPAEPGLSCGVDPTGDGLGCETYEACP